MEAIVSRLLSREVDGEEVQNTLVARNYFPVMSSMLQLGMKDSAAYANLLSRRDEIDAASIKASVSNQDQLILLHAIIAAGKHAAPEFAEWVSLKLFAHFLLVPSSAADMGGPRLGSIRVQRGRRFSI